MHVCYDKGESAETDASVILIPNIVASLSPKVTTSMLRVWECCGKMPQRGSEIKVIYVKTTGVSNTIFIAGGFAIGIYQC